MRSTHRRLASTLAVTFLLVLAACARHDTPEPAGSSPSRGQPATPSAQPATGAAAGQGRIAGVWVRPPGSDPRSGHGGSPAVPVSGDTVRAYDEHDHVAATAVTGRDGRFDLHLPPGTYRLTEDICATSVRVTAT